MSYDISILRKTEIEVFDTSITFNVYKMLQFAFEHEDGIKTLNRLEVKEGLPIVQKAVERMRHNELYLTPFEDYAGEGSFKATLRKLTDLRNSLEEQGDGIISVSY